MSHTTQSPAARKAAAAGFDFNDANIQLVVACGAIAGLVFVTQNGVTPDHFLNFFENDVAFAAWPFGGFLLTLHVLNTVQNSGGGFWVGDFVGAVIGAFGGYIASDIMNGNAQQVLANEGLVTLVFVCWYLTNHNIPFVDFGLWGTVSGFGGAALNNLMGLASAMFTTNLIIGAASSASSTAGAFGFPIFTAVTMGVVAGCAGDFFPLNKGININGGDAFDRAALISIFIATNSFGALPFVGGTVGPLFGAVTAHTGGAAGFVRAVTVVNHLFGEFIPMNPLDAVYDAFYKVTGLNRG
jgi:hypothetical protein